MGSKLPKEIYHEAQAAEKAGDLVKAVELYDYAAYFHHAARIARLLGRPDLAFSYYSQADDRLFANKTKTIWDLFFHVEHYWFPNNDGDTSRSDFSMPSTTKFGSQLTYNKFRFPVQERFNGNENREKVITNYGLIERFPDVVKRFISDKGGGITFFDGVPSDFPGLEYYKTSRAPANWRSKNHPDGRPITRDDVGGTYDIASCTALVAVADHHLEVEYEYMALHEASHLFDFCVGEALLGCPLHLSKEFGSLKRPVARFPHHRDYEYKVEFAAHAITSFYFHINTRRSLERNNQEVADLLYRIEHEIANN